jgi:N-acetylmuramic acid 6-phosphate (MurNAc-6-P) etherase
MKVAINTVSTGANIMLGKVYGNMMINVTVANNKVCLWQRACG